METDKKEKIKEFAVLRQTLLPGGEKVKLSKKEAEYLAAILIIELKKAEADGKLTPKIELKRLYNKFATNKDKYPNFQIFHKINKKI